MLPFRTGDRIFCLLCGGNRLLIHSKSIQRYPIYLSLHKILDGTIRSVKFWKKDIYIFFHILMPTTPFFEVCYLKIIHLGEYNPMTLIMKRKIINKIRKVVWVYLSSK